MTSSNGHDQEEVDWTEELNTFRILVATDNHLGYKGKDPLRGTDSLVTFEEILQLAQQHRADFLLLAGDLFHDNKPSRHIFHECVRLLRKYCYGDRPCSVQFLSDPERNFSHCSFQDVNYEDPNINVSMPVFSIHGNHDDPTGLGSLCSLDILSSAGLVNYFGKSSSVEEVEMQPVLLKKGTSHLALYGLGCIRDERLHRLFREEKVKLLQPEEVSGDWFNLLALHQNRVPHSSTNWIPEQFLSSFLHLIIWGHEHDCRVDPELNESQGFYVSQPGSSVATSLSDGEAKPKHCALLEVKGSKFKMTKLPLRTVRPFLFEDASLSACGVPPTDLNASDAVQAFCKERVEALIERASQLRSGHEKQPTLPLIRLRVNRCTDSGEDFDTFNIVCFGQQFIDRVANPKDVILFIKRHKGANRGSKKETADDGDELQLRDDQSALTIHHMIKEYFRLSEDKLRMSVLTEATMETAISEFVDKAETDAIGSAVEGRLLTVHDHLLQDTRSSLKLDMDDLDTSVREEVALFNQKKRSSGVSAEDAAYEEIALGKRLTKQKGAARNDTTDDLTGCSVGAGDGPTHSPPSPNPGPAKRGRGRGRGRGGGRGRGRGKKAADAESDGRGRAASSKASVASFFGSNSSNPLLERSRTSLPVAAERPNSPTVILSSDEELLQNTLTKAKQKKPPSRSTRGYSRKGAVFASSDEDDSPVPSSKRRKV